MERAESDTQALTSTTPSSTSADDLPLRGRSLAYWAFVLCGAGFLFPFNTFISAVDYFETAYPGSDLTFWLSVSYLWSTFVSLFLNTLVVQRTSLVWRIRFGYIVMIPLMIAVPCLQYVYNHAPNGHDVSYAMIILCSGMIGIGCGVQQGSFYGYGGMFPPIFIQALMTGEAVAGVLVSVNRIVTKWLFDQTSSLDQLAFSTAVYFGVSTAVLVLCAIMHEVVRKLPFSSVYTASASRGIELPGTKRPGLAGRTFSVGYSQPIELHSQVTHTDDDDDGDTLSPPDDTIDLAKPSVRLYDVTRKVAPAATFVFLNFFITLSVYPGLTTSAVSAPLGDWFPVLLVATFNTCDFVGRIPTAHWGMPSLRHMAWQSILRISFIPIVSALVAPATALPTPAIEILMFATVMVLGLSGGYLGSFLMMFGPTLTTAIESELSGNVMAVSLLSGLSFGSLFALVLGALVL